MTRSMTVPGWQLLTFQSPSTQAKYLLQVGSQLRALTPSPASHLSISSSSVLFSAGLKKVKPEASFMEHRKTRKIFILVVLILKVAGGMILCLVLWSQSRLPSLLLPFFFWDFQVFRKRKGFELTRKNCGLLGPQRWVSKKERKEKSIIFLTDVCEIEFPIWHFMSSGCKLFFSQLQHGFYLTLKV